jgi:hypothetical protein
LLAPFAPAAEAWAFKGAACRSNGGGFALETHRHPEKVGAICAGAFGLLETLNRSIFFRLTASDPGNVGSGIFLEEIKRVYNGTIV